ncbi:hypothetical protein HQ576_02825 [bacterium]|nr:hypothetical protein [bacterium]
MPNAQLISYIAPGAPATRRLASGPLPFLRPELGFTPRWYHEALGIDFGERWHTDPARRSLALIAMRRELARRFGAELFAWAHEPLNAPADLLTGAFGACIVPAIYGVPIRYAPDHWPASKHQHLSDPQADALEPPGLDSNPFFLSLLAQLEWIARRGRPVAGHLNWQGVLNTAYRLRGQAIFTDMALAPKRAQRLFACVATTLRDAARRVHDRQQHSGFSVGFFTVSNCLVNLVSPEQYRRFLMPHDQRLAEEFGLLGIHNCAWDATPYLDAYATLPHVGYLDMGIETDLAKARRRFPHARRAIMYTPMAVRDKPLDGIRADLERIASECGPCDIVLADIEAGTPDERVRQVAELCRRTGEAR